MKTTITVALCSLAATASADAPKVAFEKVVLPNGLQVVLRHRRLRRDELDLAHVQTHALV